MPTVTLSSGTQFTAGNSTSILDAASKAGITLPYSCTTGRCSTCKGKVLSGNTVAMLKESGLSVTELADGWILTCARSAMSDTVLEIDDLGEVQLPTPKTLPCRIDQINKLASDVVRVLLRLPPAAEFNFIAGQYIDIIYTNGVRRSYSLANADLGQKQLELHVRKVPGGVMSDYWFNVAKVNDLLRLHGPSGTFFLRDVVGRDLVFLATGTGIAPIKSMLESMPNLPQDRRPLSVTVLWGGRKPEDFYFDVSGIAGDHVYIPVNSQPTGTWRGASGYVQDVLLENGIQLHNAVVYACGSDSMIRSAKKLLVQAALPAKRFHSDAFVSSGSI